MLEMSTTSLGAIRRRFSRAAAITARSASGSALARNMAAGTPAYTQRSGRVLYCAATSLLWQTAENLCLAIRLPPTNPVDPTRRSLYTHFAPFLHIHTECIITDYRTKSNAPRWLKRGALAYF